MNAVEKLNKYINIRKLLEHYGFDSISGDGIIRSCCKIHDGNNATSFVANEDTGLWFCHSGCGGGDAYTLVQLMENCDFPTAVKRISTIFEVDIENMQITERKEHWKKEVESFIKLMQRRKNKGFKPYNIDVEIHKIISFRDFTEGTLNHFGVGFIKSMTLQGKEKQYELHDRLYFPIYNKSTLIGCSLRRTKTKDFPKWSHQPNGLITGDLLYNYESIIGKSVAVLVEGMPDVLAYYEIGVNAVCTFGAHLTKEQLNLLIKSGVEEVVLSYDGDKAGREAHVKASKLLKNKFVISEVLFKDDDDPANISREELRNLYEKRGRI